MMLVAAVSLANFAIFGLIAGLVWKRRYLAGSRNLFGLLVAMAEWSLAVGVGSLVNALSAKIFWAKMAYIGALSAAPFFLAFCLDFVQQSSWWTPARRLALWAVPVLTLILTWTNERHAWIWRNYLLDADKQTLVFEYGVGFYTYLVYVYLCALVALALLFKFYRDSAGEYRRKVKIIFVAAIVPLTIFLLRFFDSLPIAEPKLTTLSVAFSGILLAWGFLSNCLLSLTPIERSVIVDNLFDGILVLDAANRIVDINVPALKMLRLEKPPLGEDVFLALQACPLLAATLVQKPKMDVSVQLFSDPQRFVEVRMSSLENGNHQVGYLAVLRDITEQKRMEHELNKKAYELTIQASTDDLTGIFNRRFANEFLNREHHRARRYHLQLSLAIFDVDNFKTYNDMRGHAFGDACLKQIAGELVQTLRASDIAARIGGDEFLVIFPNTDICQASKALERLRKRLAAIQVDGAQAEQIHVTISGGLTQVRLDEQPEEALRRADQLLYRAKELGKDRIVADEPVDC